MHPQALGQSYRECLPKLTSLSDDLLLVLERSGDLIRETAAERYRTFFQSIDEGLCLIEALLDQDDQPIDFRILETNPAFERQVRLPQVEGKTALELLPNLDRWWIEAAGKVALTGESVRIQKHVSAMDTWFDIYAFRFGPAEQRRVAVVLHNITVRKLAEEDLKERERQFRAVADLVPDLLWSNNGEGHTTWFNRRWLEYTGLTMEQARGFGWQEAVPPEDRNLSLVRFLRALATGQRLRHEQRIRGADGQYRWFLIQSCPVLDEAGRILQWFGAATDIQDLRIAMEATRASLAEKEALLKEVHHRVKNNLQVITSLLNLQANQVQDERVLEHFEEIRSRIQSIATIHESLYRSESLAAIDLAAYAQRLAEDLVQFHGSGDRVRVETSGSGKAMLPIERAVPCGLLLNELLSNALKHAFPARRRGTIQVDVREEEGRYTMEVRDTGIGLPADLDTRQSRSLGLRLVHVLARQIGGTVVMTSDSDGTRVRTTFPRAIVLDEEEE